MSQQIITEFHLFPTFPTDIRNEIWASAAHHPRQVHLVVNASNGRDNIPSNQNQGNEVLRLQKPTIPSLQIPALLGVCAEARVQALKAYRLWFVGNVPLPATPRIPISKKSIYVNPAVDTVILTIQDGTTRFMLNNLVKSTVMGPVHSLHVPLASAANFPWQQGEVVFSICEHHDWVSDTKLFLVMKPAGERSIPEVGKRPVFDFNTAKTEMVGKMGMSAKFVHAISEDFFGSWDECWKRYGDW